MKHAALIMLVTGALLPAPANAASNPPMVIQVPADQTPPPIPRHYCRIRLALADGSILYAGRSLDAEGKRIGTSAGWTNLTGPNDNRALNLDVRFSNVAGLLAAEQGNVNFYIKTGQQMEYPVSMVLSRADNAERLTIDSGLGYEKPENATAYVPLERLLDFAGGANQLTVTVIQGEGRRARQRWQGEADLTILREVASRIAEVNPAIDVLEPDPANRCVPAQ